MHASADVRACTLAQARARRPNRTVLALVTTVADAAMEWNSTSSSSSSSWEMTWETTWTASSLVVTAAVASAPASSRNWLRSWRTTTELPRAVWSGFSGGFCTAISGNSVAGVHSEAFFALDLERDAREDMQKDGEEPEVSGLGDRHECEVAGDGPRREARRRRAEHSRRRAPIHGVASSMARASSSSGNTALQRATESLLRAWPVRERNIEGGGEFGGGAS